MAYVKKGTRTRKTPSTKTTTNKNRTTGVEKEPNSGITNGTAKKKKEEKLYSLEDIRDAKRETAQKLLSKIGLLRTKYTESQLSTSQILEYIAANYKIEIKYNKLREEELDTTELEKL